ncbi:MAG: hypothetical protein DLM70_08190 [Chloroflexi bacterium]|nr:MAG: hypothetical protein DLM70_08190 [Chloroflexota bacterium]
MAYSTGDSAAALHHAHVDRAVAGRSASISCVSPAEPQIPAVADPFFHVGATVKFHPAMLPEDLAKGAAASQHAPITRPQGHGSHP